MIDVKRLAGHAPTLLEAYDATTPEFARYVEGVEAWFREQRQPYAALDAGIRSELEAGEAIGLRLAIKIAESRRVVAALAEPTTVTLLNPVYKETGRMRPRPEHPHGEDSIRTKVETLRGLERLNEHLQARLVVIDDECPEGTHGRRAA